MGETNIEWAHYTVNAWEGCSKVSPACKHCYAEHDTPVRVVEHAMGEQFDAEPRDGKVRLKMWGRHDVRTGEGYRVETVGWEKQLRALNRKAKRLRENARDATIVVGGQEGCLIEVLRGLPYKRPRVFINSLSDTFETFEGPVYRKQNGRFEVVANSLDDVRRRLFAVIEECTELDILLLTKRPENVYDMVPNSWRCNWRPWVWLGTTVENQEMADRRIFELLRIPARVRFLSMEPLLERVDLDPPTCPTCNKHKYVEHDCVRFCKEHGDEMAYGAWLDPCADERQRGINWVIVGGESGKNARPMHPDWARKIRDQCQVAGVPFFFKQWGEWGEPDSIEHTGATAPNWSDVEGIRRHSWSGKTINGIEIPCTRPVVHKVGKKAAGRLLDGREWNEVPK